MTIIELCNGHLFFILLRNIYGVPTFLPGTRYYDEHNRHSSYLHRAYSLNVGEIVK